MRIEHSALYVFDLQETKNFFVRYFGAHCSAEYQNINTGFRSYFLSFDDGSRLELMTRPELQSRDSSGFISGYAHIAFSVGSREVVDSLTAKLASDGDPVLSGPRITGDGYYES